MSQKNYAAQQQRIEREIARLKKQAEALQQKQRNPVIAQIIRTMKEYSITPAEISAAYSKKTSPRASTGGAGKAAPRKAAKRVIPAKYRNPETGDTWTGRGKAPRWISEAEAQGKKREQFLIA
ncbi:H-NS histone family protein [Paracandidimonas soli]|uniref:H-NS histone family protein n=1 Tax=Paracandidimonas soli TaxID=1917182 RepID=UPI003342A545